MERLHAIKIEIICSAHLSLAHSLVSQWQSYHLRRSSVLLSPKEKKGINY